MAIAYKFRVNTTSDSKTLERAEEPFNINPKSVMKIEPMTQIGATGLVLDNGDWWAADTDVYYVATLWDKTQCLIDGDVYDTIRKNQWGEP